MLTTFDFNQDDPNDDFENDWDNEKNRIYSWLYPTEYDYEAPEMETGY